jgi:hypothetical protein
MTLSTPVFNNPNYFSAAIKKSPAIQYERNPQVRFKGWKESVSTASKWFLMLSLTPWFLDIPSSETRLPASETKPLIEKSVTLSVNPSRTKEDISSIIAELASQPCFSELSEFKPSDRMAPLIYTLSNKQRGEAYPLNKSGEKAFLLCQKGYYALFYKGNVIILQTGQEKEKTLDIEQMRKEFEIIGKTLLQQFEAKSLSELA